MKLSDCVEQKNRSKIGIVWEEENTEFKRCVEMPKKGTPLYSWQQNQLAASLNAKIRNDLAKNKGSTVGVNGE